MYSFLVLRWSNKSILETRFVHIKLNTISLKNNKFPLGEWGSPVENYKCAKFDAKSNKKRTRVTTGFQEIKKGDIKKRKKGI